MWVNTVILYIYKSMSKLYPYDSLLLSFDWTVCEEISVSFVFSSSCNFSLSSFSLDSLVFSSLFSASNLAISAS